MNDSQRTQIVNKTEDYLKYDDKISLLFLLVDNAESALKYAESSTPIQDWCNVQTQSNWFSKLEEALCIVGCNKMLKISKQSSYERFLPENPESSLIIDLLRKNLYLMCEDLTEEECSELINMMEPKSDNKHPSPYLEKHLLEWLYSNKIASDNMQTLSKALESMGKKKWSERLLEIVEKSKQFKVPFNPTYNTHAGKGFGIIINQKQFHNNPNRTELETRIGTDVDRDRLIEAFKMFNMVTEVWENVTRENLINDLSEVSQKLSKDCSFFVLCVLSHGEEGVVYCADNTTIRIRDITKKFSGQLCPALIDKPKLFIIQACKGNYAQIAVNQPSPAAECVPAHRKTVATDSPNDLVPDQADQVVFHSTVPGFASFRHLLHGTWFIDAFCTALLFETQKKDMSKVFLHINSIASDKKILIDEKVCVTMPMYTITLRRDFRLNFHPEGVVESTVQCLERILFGCLLEEYLDNYSPEK